jgi:AcrR family transcriptional regulator
VATTKLSRRRTTPGTRDTSELLVRAASQEFRQHGFEGTDSNKIAHRAGFAPQTFYRWFSDKTEIFIAVYRLWEEEERQLLSRLMATRGSVSRLAAAIVAYHREHLLFRRSLRTLAVANPAVRRARAESRLRQLDRLSKHGDDSTAARDAAAIALLKIERLADAVAEGELQDLGIADKLAMERISELLRELTDRS